MAKCFIWMALIKVKIIAEPWAVTATPVAVISAIISEVSTVTKEIAVMLTKPVTAKMVVFESTAAIITVTDSTQFTSNLAISPKPVSP